MAVFNHQLTKIPENFIIGLPRLVQASFGTLLKTKRNINTS